MKKIVKIIISIISLLIICILMDIICIHIINKPLLAISKTDNNNIIYKGLFYDTYFCSDMEKPTLKAKWNKFSCKENITNYVVHSYHGYFYEDAFQKIITNNDELNLIKDKVYNLNVSYDDNFFENNSLFALFFPLGSGSVESDFDKIDINDSIDAYINVYYPEFGTTDMSGYIYLIEMKNSDLVDKEIKVHLVNNGFYHSMRTYCNFTKTLTFIDIKEDEGYYYYNFDNVGDKVTYKVKKYADFYKKFKNINLIAGKKYEFNYEIQLLEKERLLDELYTEIVSIKETTNEKNDDICPYVKVFVKEILFMDKPIELQFDNQKYYFYGYNGHMPYKLEIESKLYTINEALEQKFITLNDLEKAGYKIEKSN